MQKFTVTIPLAMTVDVCAKDEQSAREDAEAWVRWIDPTQEQFDDFKSDHDTGLQTSGDLDFAGKLEVEAQT